MRKMRPTETLKAARRHPFGTALLVAAFACATVPAAQAATSSGGTAAGSAAAATGSSGLVVMDRSHDNDSPDDTLYALYEIVNNSTTAVPLSELTMRYYFINAPAPTPGMAGVTTASPVFFCDWAAVGCANVTQTFVTLPSGLTGADTYSQIGFTSGAGSIPAGGSTGELQTRIEHNNWTWFQSGASYSFISDPSFVYKATTTVTLYLNGQLIWGTPPAGAS